MADSTTNGGAERAVASIAHHAHPDPIEQQPAMLSNLAYANLIANVNLSQQNAVANQQALNQLGIAVLGKSVNVVANLNPLEAASAGKLLTGNQVAEEIASLNAALAVNDGGVGATTDTK